MAKKFTLKQIRTAKKLTQEQLEALSGIPQQNISKIERCAVLEPGFTTGLALADALGVDPHILKFGEVTA